ncbi:hypothetical protein SLA2020_264100 [Shorea laevis]
MSTGPGLESLVDRKAFDFFLAKHESGNYISYHNDGRNIVFWFPLGSPKGFDQATNIILDESHERVYSTKEGVQHLCWFVHNKGRQHKHCGELDEELDSSLDLSKLRAHPLKPVIH